MPIALRQTEKPEITWYFTDTNIKNKQNMATEPMSWTRVGFGPLTFVEIGLRI